MLKCGTLSKKETEQVNERVRQALEEAKVGKKRSATRGAYTGRHSEVTILWRHWLSSIGLWSTILTVTSILVWQAGWHTIY